MEYLKIELSLDYIKTISSFDEIKRGLEVYYQGRIFRCFLKYRTYISPDKTEPYYYWVVEVYSTSLFQRTCDAVYKDSYTVSQILKFFSITDFLPSITE